jgi:uncharacterized membrane protein YhaH (DUF805 family)
MLVQWWCPMNIEWMDIVLISTMFVLTLITFFDRSVAWHRKRLLNYVLLGWLALYTAIMLYGPKSMETKIFAALMLFSALVVEAAMWKRIHGSSSTR